MNELLNIGPDFIDGFIKSAERLGGLTPAAIFAFMWLWRELERVRDKKIERELKKKDMEKREAAILAEERQTEALKAVAQNLVMVRDSNNNLTLQVSRQNTILEERLPHK